MWDQGFSAPKSGIRPVETPCGISVFEFHMIHQIPHGEKRAFHMETLCGIRVFVPPKVGFCPWKPYVGLAFSSFTRSISFHIEKQGFSHGKPMWDQGFRAPKSGILPVETLCGISVFEFHMIDQIPHGEKGAFHMENLCGIRVSPPWKLGLFPRKPYVGLAYLIFT